MSITVSMCGMEVCASPGETLVTYSLGSCVGVTLYDPQTKVGGLVHCMLPLSKLDPEKAKAKPAMFTDTGFVKLLHEVLASGARKDRLIVKVAGGGSPMDTAGRFKIGERNYAVLRKLLWKNDILIAAEDVGGSHPRTMRLRLSDGQVTISTGKDVKEL